MSIDKSLKSHNILQRHRSVLTRAERIKRLEDEERRAADDSVLGLPKVRNLQAKRVRPKHEKAEADAEAAGAESGEAPTATE